MISVQIHELIQRQYWNPTLFFHLKHSSSKTTFVFVVTITFAWSCCPIFSFIPLLRWLDEWLERCLWLCVGQTDLTSMWAHLVPQWLILTLLYVVHQFANACMHESSCGTSRRSGCLQVKRRQRRRILSRSKKEWQQTMFFFFAWWITLWDWWEAKWDESTHPHYFFAPLQLINHTACCWSSNYSGKASSLPFIL